MSRNTARRMALIVLAIEGRSSLVGLSVAGDSRFFCAGFPPFDGGFVLGMASNRELKSHVILHASIHQRSRVAPGLDSRVVVWRVE